LEQAISLYDPQKHPRFTVGTADPRIDCLSYVSWALWNLGYPDQALERSHEAITLAQGLSHSYSLAYASACAAGLHSSRREWRQTRECAEKAITLSTEHGFPSWVAVGTVSRGEALVEQGQAEEGVAQIRQGMAAYQTTGSSPRPHYLALLAEAYGKVGQEEEGITLLTEALEIVHDNGECCYEAELYRLEGKLTLQKEFNVQGSKFQDSDARSPLPDAQAEAEACFHKAIEVARRQQAKSLELRATVSLARLWQRQGKKKDAHQMLVDIYGWFTEGFDTKDLQEAKALLAELSERGR
jgi:predicted ATPase